MAGEVPHASVHERGTGKYLPKSRQMMTIPGPFFTGHNQLSRHKFGANPDIDIATAPEDVWNGGGAYPFPSVMSTVSVVSDDINDTVGGTGLRQIVLFGLDKNWDPLTVYMDMDGTTPSVSTSLFCRLFSANSHLAGSSGANEGTITITHVADAAVIGQIDPLVAATQQAIYTVPRNMFGEILAINIDIEGSVATVAQVQLQMKHNHPFDSPGHDHTAWSTIERVEVTEANDVHLVFAVPLFLEPRTDIRFRVASTSSNATSVVASFDILVYRPI